MSILLMAVLLLVGVLVFFLLLGGLTPGSGADLLDWNPGKRMERIAAADQDDFEELLELNNRHRRARGLPELVEGDIRPGRNLGGAADE